MPFVSPIDPVLKEKAKDLILKGLTAGKAAAKLGLKATTVAKWRERENWTIFDDALSVGEIKRVRDKPLQQLSHSARLNLAETVVMQSRLVREKHPKSLASVRNTKSEQGLAATLKTIAESAAIVFDWKSDSRPGTLIVVGEMKNTAPEQGVKRPGAVEPIDIKTELSQ